MPTPTASSEVASAINSRTPIVAQIRALHDRLLRAEILASAGKVHRVVDMPDADIVEGPKALISLKTVSARVPMQPIGMV